MRDERGFTLLEVMVAALIAAAVFAVLLPTGLTGIRTVRAAGAYETAMALARSHLAMLGRNPADESGDLHGKDGPFDWRVRVAPEAAVDPGPGIVNWFLHRDEARVTLYAVSVIVSWQSEGRRRELRLDTQRLGTAPPPPSEIP
jgi:prepilin-type N-terminal cleavage/methylation domain-containing protein